jgi:diketogulonate reductase-like aldo/keto reductase
MRQELSMVEEPSVIRLSNGVALPRIGLGTFKARGRDVRQAVQSALACGIRHIDTASIYKVGFACSLWFTPNKQEQGLPTTT